MKLRLSRLLRRLRCRRGVALPVALMSLIVTSALVATVMVTTSGEVARSHLQMDATQAMFAAQAGIEQYVASAGLAAGPLAVGTIDVATGHGPVRLTVEHLATRIDGTVIDSTYSVTAELHRATGARSVAAMFTRRFTEGGPVQLAAGLPSGLNLGASTEIKGNADVKKAPSGKLPVCNKAGAESKVTFTSDAQIKLTGNAAENIGSDTTRAAWTRQQMIRQVLGVDSLRQLVSRADITFGVSGSVAPIRQTAFNESAKTMSPNLSQPAYDWGCPQGIVSCGTGARMTWLPVVVIDAKGGTVRINQEYGQGLLVILNGNVHFNAGYSFKGLIAVEGLVNLNGNIHIEGSVLAQGITAGEPIVDDDGIVNGTQDIYFNRCAVEEVIETFNKPPAGSPVPAPLPPALSAVGRTFSWAEVVR